jgi:ribosomal protein L37E
MKQLRKRIVSLIQSGSITDTQEKENLERLIKTKKWNPYCIRHSAITADSDYLPEFALRKKARWVMNSKQPSRYIKARMGNDLKQKILVQNGIITEVDAKPMPTVADCARCRTINPLENKYCSSCGYPLSVAAYEELKAAETEKIAELKTQIDKMKQDHSEMLGIKAQMDEMKQKMDQWDLVDLHSFPSDYTIHNLLADCGIDSTKWQDMTAQPERERQRAREEAERLRTKLIRPVR